MLFSKLSVALAVGAALEAVAHPTRYTLEARKPLPVPALPAPEIFPAMKRDGGRRGGDRNRNRNNDEIVQIKQVEVNQVIQQDNQIAIVQQKVQQVLVINNDRNRRRNDKRRNFYRNRDNDVTNVLLVVQKVNVVNIDNNSVKQAQLFAVSAVTANEGKRQTNTLMITEASAVFIDARETGWPNKDSQRQQQEQQQQEQQQQEGAAQATGAAEATGAVVATGAADAGVAQATAAPQAEGDAQQQQDQQKQEEEQKQQEEQKKQEEQKQQEEQQQQQQEQADQVTLVAEAPTWSAVVDDVPEATDVPVFNGIDINEVLKSFNVNF